MSPYVIIGAVVVIVVMLYWENIVSRFTGAANAVGRPEKRPVPQHRDPRLQEKLEREREAVIFDKLERSDQDAISHLRKRAVDSGDEKLVALIRKVAIGFYDVHSTHYEEEEE